MVGFFNILAPYGVGITNIHLIIDDFQIHRSIGFSFNDHMIVPGVLEQISEIDPAGSAPSDGIAGGQFGHRKYPRAGRQVGSDQRAGAKYDGIVR